MPTSPHRTAAVVAIGAALLGCGDGTGAGRDDRRLVLTVSDATGQRLAYARADGSRIRPIAGTEEAAEGVWSPDGRTIAFTRRGRTHPADNRTDLWLLDVASGQARSLVTSPFLEESRPGWSPDGRSVVFDRDGTIWVVPAAGGPADNLGEGFWPAWRPDGRISFTRMRTDASAPRFRLMVMSASGEDPVTLTAEDAVQGFPGPVDAAWSRSGRLAVVDTRGAYPGGTTRWSLLVLDVATGERASVLADSLPLLRPTWSPDGATLLVTRVLGDGMSVWAVAADGTRLRRLTPVQSNPAGPSATYAYASWR